MTERAWIELRRRLRAEVTRLEAENDRLSALLESAETKAALKATRESGHGG